MTQTTPRRRLFRFSLRTLLIVVMLLSLLLGWFALKMRRAERQRQAVEAIWEAGGNVYYYHNPIKIIKDRSSTPAWLRRLVGDDFFSDIVAASFHDPMEADDVALDHLKDLAGLKRLFFSGTQITDAGLENLKGLTKLQWLDVSGTQVTDAGLEQFKGLTSLKTLDVSGTQVTDTGLEHLKEMTTVEWIGLADTQITDGGLEHLKGLTNLRYVTLDGTQVTAKGIEEVRKALPNCAIDWEPTPNKPKDQRCPKLTPHQDADGSVITGQLQGY